MDGFGASDNEVDDVDDGPLENETSGMEIARRWGQAMLSDTRGGGSPLPAAGQPTAILISANTCLQPGLHI